MNDSMLAAEESAFKLIWELLLRSHSISLHTLQHHHSSNHTAQRSLVHETVHVLIS